jgi:hypothetical protein
MSMILMAVSVGCASDPGTHPHDLSVVQHESAARQEETRATAHGAEYDPAAAKDSTVCGQAGTIRPATQSGPPCWTSRSNPTEQHTREAAEHRELAAKHRAASAALVQAEQRACAGIDEDDRDISPFYHREDIASVGPVEILPRYSGKSSPDQVVGAAIAFRPVPGITTEWLQHVVNCHLARASAAGHEMPEMLYCPLALKGVQATVSSAGDALAVRVTSDDTATAQEILRRAQMLQAKR